MPKYQDDNKLLVRLMTMYNFWPMMRNKMMTVAVQVSWRGADVIAKYSIHVLCLSTEQRRPSPLLAVSDVASCVFSVLSYFGPTSSCTCNLPKPKNENTQVEENQRHDQRAVAKEWIVSLRNSSWFRGHSQAQGVATASFLQGE